MANLDVLKTCGEVSVHRKLAVVAAAIAALAVIATVQPCQGHEPYENQWGPFTGTVVDASTGEPIPGAVVTAIWRRWIPMIAEAQSYFYDARVAVADKAGRFEIPRRFPALLGFLIHPVYLSCTAPEYAPFRDVGAQYAPISVKLRRLSLEEIRLALFDDVLLGAIPHDKRPELEKTINQTRKRMGLRAIYYPTGGYQKE